MNLDNAFFPTLIEFARAIETPAEFLLRALWLESRLDPKSHRTGSRYYGLNQLDSAFLRQRGVDPDTYLRLPASEQLRLGVLPYWTEQLRVYKIPTPLRSPGVVQAIQLAPARVRDGAAGRVLYVQGEPGYTGNRGLDRDHDGRIVIGDLDYFFDAVMPRQGDWSTYQTAVARLEQAEGFTRPAPLSVHAPSNGPSIVGYLSGAVLLGTLGYAAYQYATRS